MKKMKRRESSRETTTRKPAGRGPLRVLIADDHPLIREGLKKILREETDMVVVGEAAQADEIFDRLDHLPVDVVLLDISLPQKSGLEVLKDLKLKYPAVQVLILSMHPEDRFAIRALKAGAAGYITKDEAAGILVEALRAVAAGKKHISASLAQRLAAEVGVHRPGQLHEGLSDREFQVLCLLAAGKTVKEIALHLSLSANTVHTYRARVFEKMKMGSVVELTRYAMENRLIE